jgi:hypothetical protein
MMNHVGKLPRNDDARYHVGLLRFRGRDGAYHRWADMGLFPGCMGRQPIG